MKRLFLILSLLVIGCSDSLSPTSENCDCSLDITSDLPQTDDVYELEYNSSLAQTYSVLSCQQWISLVNPASMTDEFGEGNVVFAVWEEFIGHTITIYGGYTDDCGHHFVDSVKVRVVDNE